MLYEVITSSLYPPNGKVLIEKVVDELSKIDSIRKNVNTLNIEISKAISYYTNINSMLLKFIAMTALTAEDDHIINDINTLYNFLMIVITSYSIHYTKLYDQILETFFKELNRYSFNYNLDLYKFIKKLDKDDSKQVYTYCNEKLESIFSSKEDEISILILEYMLENDEKQKVYDYISTLTLKSYLQQLS